MFLDKGTRQRVGRRWTILFAPVCAITLYLGYSRIAVIATVMGIGFGWVWQRVRFQFGTLLVTLAAVATGIIGTLIVGEAIANKLVELNDQRAGSFVARTDIYESTIDAIDFPEAFLVGSGVKQRRTDLVASLGSHNTYLGLLYRGGALVLAAFVFLLLRSLFRSIRGRERGVGRSAPVLRGVVGVRGPRRRPPRGGGSGRRHPRCAARPTFPTCAATRGPSAASDHP